MLSIRDSIHGFIRADALETALLDSRPMQRLRFVRQLGWSFLVFPGAEHNRFSHVLGTMHLAGRLYDALAAKGVGDLPADPRCRERRLVRVAALLHDIGHAPFSHSAEDLFDGDLDHEDMTCLLLKTPEMQEIFAEKGDGIDGSAVIRLLRKEGTKEERLLSEIVTGELDVDKMDYLQRDSFHCGVRYGLFDLERLLDVVIPVADPDTGAWRIGIDHGGVHALEALVMARYYMFTQVYFNATGKVMELHYAEWLRSENRTWPADPEAFLEYDDVALLAAMRRSKNRHARALVDRQRFKLAFETEEHLTPGRKALFEDLLPGLHDRFGESILVDYSAKDPHRMSQSRVYTRRFDGRLQPVAEASDFIAHMSKINAYRVYAEPARRDDVRTTLGELWPNEAPG